MTDDDYPHPLRHLDTMVEVPFWTVCLVILLFVHDLLPADWLAVRGLFVLAVVLLWVRWAWRWVWRRTHARPT